MGALFAVVVLAGGAALAEANSAAADLAAGIAARESHPPDLAAARSAFEQAAQARDDDRSSADALYYLGELDDLALSFPAAIAHYEASVARLPSGRFAPRAVRRASELRGTSEGDFRPLIELETIRRSPDLANDPTKIDELAKDAASFPPGRVRVDARMLVAEAYTGRLGRKEDALPLLRLVAGDPKADVLTAREAASELLAAYVAKKDYPSALAVTAEYRRLLPIGTARDVLRLMRRRPIRYAAWGDLAVLTAFALFALRGPRPSRARVVLAVRRVAPMALLFAILASLGAGFLASRYEQTSPYPFTALLPAMFAISILARAGSAGGGSGHVVARSLRAVVSFAGIFAAAFLMLDRMDPTYLAGFGL